MALEELLKLYIILQKEDLYDEFIKYFIIKKDTIR